MKNYKLIISYDGTCYCGWQIQPNAPTIQEIIQNALSCILKKPTFIVGSGRTDSGVHALGQVAHFQHESPIDIRKVHLSLNGLLPKDIRILSMEQTADNFHARYSALGKIYRYHLHFDPIMNPFKRGYCYHVRHKIDLTILDQASKRFIGTHDFTSFSNESRKGAANRNPIRTITRIEMFHELGGIYLEYEGNGFLYQMIRNITGTLLEVSKGKISLKELEDLFVVKDRRKAGKALPPYGLFLVKVNY